MTNPPDREPPGRLPRRFGGLRLGRAFGVAIHVDWSLLIIFALIATQLGAGVLPRWHPEWSPGLVWVVALGAALAFFASVLAHELSHALVGRAQGIPIRRITLFLFGGVAELEREPDSPKAELLMAIVGPLVSIAIGVLSILVAMALPETRIPSVPERADEVLRSLGPTATLLMWLGPINILLGLFNLVPGFPLDGGRVARSILWWMTGDLLKATRWAAGAGQVVAWLIMGWGMVNLFVGALVQAVWLLLIGWFLANAARASYEQLLIHRALESVPVSRLMYSRMDLVSPDVSVEAFVRDHLMTGDQAAYPVVDELGTLLGLVTMQDVRRRPSSDWPAVSVAEIMTQRDELVSLSPRADASEALRELGQRDVEQLPVIEGGRVLGLVRRRDLVKWIALQRSGEAYPRGV